MNRSFLPVLLLTLLLVSCTDSRTRRIAVIPQPQKAEIKDGRLLHITAETALIIENAGEDDRRRLAERAGSILNIVNQTDHAGDNAVVLRIADDGTYAESYTIDISATGIGIVSPSAAGLFRALETLRMLGNNGSFPQCRIEDAPRFPYRGVMLDISRHFFGKEHIKKQIEILSRYKINRLHLHLTDAAGWRIEIESYPRLTQLAAWRTDSLWKRWWNGGRKYAEQGSDGTYGGFLTKDDIREIVAFAADRYMTVIPEIEMPSHSEEVMAAYPELSCTHGRNIQGDLCIGNEQTFAFLESVLEEVMELFPSKQIHIGGDEAAMNNWRSCPLCRKRMHDEGLETVQELQGYIIRRIERFVQSHGREIIGWDEILDGGTSTDATVMCWRGTERGIAAARQGHNVIMTPGEFCYFDSWQDAPYTQPEAIGGYLPLAKVYSYDPAPDSLDNRIAERIRGVQANLWAEYIPTPEQAEYMLYPRLLALAEVAWSSPKVKDFDDFHKLALEHTAALRSGGVNAFDLSTETGNRPEAEQPTEHLALGSSVIYAEDAEYFPSYAAGGNEALVDGLRGGWSYGDRRWQGFVNGRGVDVTIDLGLIRELHFIGADFMQMCGPEVFMPSEVIISVSDDGSNFTELAHIRHEVVKDEGASFKNFAWEGLAKGRYIRYQALHGPFGGFLFTDEIVIK